MPGAIVQGTNTTDRINCGSGADIDSLTVFTAIMWMMVITLTANRMLVTKIRPTLPAGTRGWRLMLNGTGGNVEFFQGRATTGCSYITNDTPLSTTSKWYCVGLVVNHAATPVVRIYTGDLASLVAERTYGTATDGAGIFDTDATPSLFWGNRDATTPDLALQGRIALGALFGAALGTADLQSWQREPRLTVGANTALRFGRGGKDGADWIEYSGAAAGTVTGGTQGDGPPVGGHWMRSAGGLYQRAA